MGIGRSTYYDVPTRAPDDTALVEVMHAIMDEFEAYGWRQMQAALGQKGRVVNHKKLRRLTGEQGSMPDDGAATSSPPTATTTSRSSRTGRKT